MDSGVNYTNEIFILLEGEDMVIKEINFMYWNEPQISGDDGSWEEYHIRCEFTDEVKEIIGLDNVWNCFIRVFVENRIAQDFYVTWSEVKVDGIFFTKEDKELLVEFINDVGWIVNGYK